MAPLVLGLLLPQVNLAFEVEKLAVEEPSKKNMPLESEFLLKDPLQCSLLAPALSALKLLPT